MIRSSRLLMFLAVLSVLSLLLSATPASAAPSVSIQGYTGSGGFVPVDDGGTIPVGARLKVRVWTDLYGCDPVTVGWGDGTSETKYYGGAFSLDWYHTYDVEGTYTITAEDCPGATDFATISVGAGGFDLFDPSSALFVPTFLGLVLGLLALGLANARPQGPGRRGAMGAPVPVPPPPARPVLKPGVPASMTQHIVSLRDIPHGALRQPQPTIPIRAGHATNVLQRMNCQCGAPLGYTAAGCFCTSEACGLRNQQAAASQFVQVGQNRASDLLP